MRTNVRMSAIACMAWAWLTPASLSGQSYIASLRGTVTGPTGGVVPGSQVTLVNEGTNARQVKSANERGAYLFTLLPDTESFPLQLCKLVHFPRPQQISAPPLYQSRWRLWLCQGWGIFNRRYGDYCTGGDSGSATLGTTDRIRRGTVSNSLCSAPEDNARF